MPSTSCASIHLQAGLDEQLLGERVTDLHRRAVGRAVLLEGGAGQDADAADAVATGLGAEQHDDVADPARGRQLDATDRHHTEAERVDERVALVRRVEHDLTADVGQAQAVAVAPDARDDPGQHAQGVGVVGVAEAQGVHDQDRARAHGEDVADDPADPRGRALVGLDVGRVVVRLDLERDREALAHVDDAGVLAHPDEHPLALGDVAELAQVHLGALVGAVLAPHDRVHRELGGGRAAAEERDDPGVLVVLEPELGVGHRVVRRGLRALDRVEHQALTRALSTEVKKPSPSVPGPVRASTACSGCGMSPTTLPRSLVMPAMSRRLPLGLPPV